MKKCSICKEREVYTKNRCKRCAQYHYKHGVERPLNIKRINEPSLIGCLRKDGYVVLSIKGKRILQHTYVMENYLKRKLFKGENIHHKNGVRSDNRIENLQLWNNNHPSGQSVEDKIDWCIKFLNIYGYKVHRR